jgi:hypothetical protein
MYGLPSDFDATFLVGQEVIQIRVGQHQIILSFPGNTYISIVFAFSLNDADPLVVGVDSATYLLPLIGHVVCAATRIGKGDLRINFDDGHSLIILESEDNYESYQIMRPGETIVV